MRNHGLILLCVMLALPAGCLQAGDSGLSEIEKHERLQSAYLQAAQQLVERPSRRTVVQEAMEAAFQELYAPPPFEVNLGGLSDEDLAARLQAFHLATFYRSDSARVRHVFELFEALRQREAVTPALASKAYASTIRARQFGLASRIQAADVAGRLPPVPPVDETPVQETARETGHLRSKQTGMRRPVLKVEDEGFRLSRRTVDLSGARVVVLVSLTCTPSTTAMSELAKAPEWQSLLERHFIWLIPPKGYLQYEAVREWNADSDLIRLHLVDSRGDWPEVDVWSTPTFLFFENGRLEAVENGWPDWQGVQDGLRAIGLDAERMALDNP